MKIFKYIKADPFFKEFCPHIKNHKRKISGVNGRGNPAEFSPEEKKKIVEGIKQMFKTILANPK